MDEETPRFTRKTIQRLGLLLIGAILLTGLVWRAGPEEVWNDLTQVGWGFLLLLALALLWNTIAVFAWRVLFDPDHPSIGWKVLWHTRICGEGVNTLTPFLNLGGEPVKVWLLKHRLERDQGTTYVVLDKTIYFLASLLYMASGVLVGVFVFSGHPLVLAAAGGILLLLLGGLLYLIRRQHKGHTVLAVIEILEKIGIKIKPAFRERMEEVDRDLSAFWRQHRARFLLSLLLNFLGRVVRTVDVWVIARMLESPVDAPTAYFISAAAVIVNATFAFIPGALGAYEGGHGYLFKLLGMGLETGIAMGIIRRIRTLTFAAFGYLLLVLTPMPEPRGGAPTPLANNAPSTPSGGASMLAAFLVFAGLAWAVPAGGQTSPLVPAYVTAQADEADKGDEDSGDDLEGQDTDIEEVVLSMEELVAVALGKPAFQALQSAGPAVAEANRTRASRARWAPRIEMLNIFTGINEARGDVTYSPNRDTDFLSGLGIFNTLSIDLVQPLYTFGKLTSGMRAADAGLAAAEAKNEVQEAELTLNVRKAYWGFLASRDIYSVLRGAENTLNDVLERIQKNLDADNGENTNTDLWEMEVVVGKLVGQIQEVQDGYERARLAISTFLNLEPKQRFKPADRHLRPPKAPLRDMDYYLAAAAANHPKLKLVNAGVRAKEALADLAAAQRYPDIFVGVKFNWATAPNRDNQSNPFVYDPFNGIGGGPFLGLRWNLALHQTNAELASARAQLAEIRAQRDALLLQIELETKDAYVQTAGAKKAYEIYKKAAKSSKKLFRAQTLNFGIGVIKVAEIKAAYSEYLEMRATEMKRLLDFNEAVAQLHQAVGLDLGEASGEGEAE